MRRYKDEFDRPSEWMRALEEGSMSYTELIAESAGMAAAAYRLARAIGKIRPVSSEIPTAAELYAAAGRIAQALSNETVPPRAQLIDACEFAGLPVIKPTRALAA